MMPTKTQSKPKTTAEKVIDRLERVVRRADDFVLGFVKCNHPSQREEIRHAFFIRVEDRRVLEIELDQPIVSLLDEITARWDAVNPPDAVCVYGLEHSINIDGESSPVLGRLNNDRDLLRRTIPVPLLIWLPDYALDLVVRGAPDFWAWRSGVYEFPTETGLWQSDGIAALYPDVSNLFSLTFNEKRQEIARLEELVRTAHTLPQQDERGWDLIAHLLHQLGVTYHSLGEWEMAQSRYEESIRISEQLCNKAGSATTLHQLAMLQQDKGNLSDAEGLYKQSLDIKKQLSLNSAANTLHQLGNIQWRQGNLLEAERLYMESLEINEQTGDRYGVAGNLGQLGLLQKEQGNSSEAEELYQQSLAIFQQLGDNDGVGTTLHQLARLRRDQGNLAEAERLYQQSLAIFEQMGDKNRVSVSLWHIGSLWQMQEQLHNALSNYIASWMLQRELQPFAAEWVRQPIQDIRQQVGEEQFYEWLHEDFGQKAKSIVKALDAERDASETTTKIAGAA